MKSKNITVILVVILMAFAGYFYYKKFKQDSDQLDKEMSQSESNKDVGDATASADTSATATDATTPSADTSATAAPAATTDAKTDATAASADTSATATPAATTDDKTAVTTQSADTSATATPAATTDAKTDATAASAETSATAAPEATTDAKTDATAASADTSATVQNEATTPVTKQDVANIVKSEINKNPELVVQALKDHADNQQKIAEANVLQAIQINKDALINDSNDHKYGEATAKNVVIQFYDYSCGHCRNMSAVVEKLIDEKTNMYLVFKELPALGDSSIQASKAALAVNKLYPKKFLDFHFALMNDNSTTGMDQKIKNIAKTLKINEGKLYKEMSDPAIDAILQDNFKLAGKIGIRGVPDIIINDKLYPGAISYEQAKADLKQ